MLKLLPHLVFLLAASRLVAAPFINEFHAENIGPLLPSTGLVLVGVEDVDGAASDWVELRNPGPGAVDLTGWALSDDTGNRGKWVFPAQTLAADGYLVVFASGKDRRVPGVQLHTNFKLGNRGVILLSQPNGAGGWTVVHQIGTGSTAYPAQKPRFSYGYAKNHGADTTPQLGYMELQSPGADNAASVVTAFVESPTVSVPRGLFTSAQAVALTTATPGARLIYTLDGSEPTFTSTPFFHGMVVNPPDASTPPSTVVNITGTTCLRVRAVKDGLGASDVVTHSYLFPAATLNQTAPAQSFLTWGSNGPDWAMDLLVTNHASVDSRCVADDLRAIPSVSVVMDWNDLFGTGTTPGGTRAIYPPASGVPIEGAERRVSVEWLNPLGSKTDPNTARGFQQDGNMDIFGGNSPNRWNSDKLSLKVNFIPDLHYRLYGAGSPERYDNLVLDARYNNVWHYGGTTTNPEDQRLRSDYYGDAFTSDLQRMMGWAGTHAQPVHVYLNGLYWGMYIAHERPDQHFAAAYLGGDEDDWDVIKHRANPDGSQAQQADSLVAGKVLDPTQPLKMSNHTAGVNYLAMVAVVNQDLTVPANYAAAEAKIDLPAFIDYILLNFYFGNTDWSDQNWYASYRRTATDARWRWHSWDAEHIMEDTNHNVTADGTQAEVIAARGPGYIHERLRTSVLYRDAFADRAHAHLFNGGLLTNPRVWQLFDAKMQVFSEALRAESARWGDNRAALRPAPKTGQPYLRGVEWFAQRAWWQTTYFPARSNTANGASTNTVLNQLRAQILYPPENSPAPVFSQHGGAVPTNYQLTISGTGLLVYTTDGSDPLVPSTTTAFTGTRRAGFHTVSGPIALTSSVTIKARAQSGQLWSALTEAYFSVGTVPAAAGNLVISKIQYQPPAATAGEILAGYERANFEFIEVLNIGGSRVLLAGIIFSDGVTGTLTPGGVRELAPGGRALFVAKRAAFESHYGSGLPIAGEFSFDSNLSNSGETLTLLAANGATIASFAYGTTAPWPIAANGQGPALVLMRPGSSDPAQPANWRQSTIANGGPGVDDRLSFAAWQAQYFPGGGAGSAPEEDPDGDGLKNLVEFGLGTNPSQFTPADQQPVAALELLDVGAGPQLYATFTFLRVKAAEELTWSAETSTDLHTWSVAAADLVADGPPIDHTDGTETVRYRATAPFAATTPRYFRARVVK